MGHHVFRLSVLRAMNSAHCDLGSSLTAPLYPFLKARPTCVHRAISFPQRSCQKSRWLRAWTCLSDSGLDYKLTLLPAASVRYAAISPDITDTADSRAEHQLGDRTSGGIASLKSGMAYICTTIMPWKTHTVIKNRVRASARWVERDFSEGKQRGWSKAGRSNMYVLRLK